MSVQSLGYLVIETTDPVSWDGYLTDIVGAMPNGTGSDGAALYRLDERAARFRILKSDQNRLSVVGWEMADKAAFDEMVARLKKAGREVTIEDSAARGVAALASSSDPGGNRLELFYGAEDARSDFVSPAGVSGFVTGNLGMGHVVYGSQKFDELHSFYNDVMGFGDTDIPRIEAGPPGSPTIGVAFMHAATGRHHSVAVIEMPEPPSGCVHIMVEAAAREDVDAAYERMQQAGIEISATLGQHTNDEVISFYMKCPAGFDVEFGWDGLVLDPATWVPTAHTTPSKWGHEWAWQKAMAEQMAKEAAAQGEAKG